MKLPDHYSLMSEGDKHFDIHDGRDNTTFKVAKQGLHPANQMHILRLKKYADGGDVEPDDDSSTPSSVPPFLAANPPVEQTNNAPSGNAAELPQGPTQVGGMQTPAKTPDTLAQFQANQGLEESGLKAQGAAQAKMGAENAKAYEDANSKISKFLESSNVPIDSLARENDSMAQQLADPKSNVDPNNYYHNLGTGGQIRSALALIIGGIGSGLTGGPNVAMQVINNAIARDIESQKLNLGKKESLLSTNLARFKDMKMAQTATLAQMNSMVQGQIAATTARYGGLAGQAGTQSALGQLKNQNLQSMMNLKQQVFQQQLQQHLASGDVTKDNPLDYVRWTVPPDKQKEVATELGKAQYASSNHDKLMELWDKAQKEQTMMRTGFGLFDAPATRELKLLGDPLIHEADGRVNEFEKKDFEGTLPSSGQTDQRQKELRDGFEQFIMGKGNAPLAKTFGIDVDKFNATKMKGSDQERVITRGPDKGKTAIFDSNKNFKGYK
jgi:hypothetical protein